MSTSKEDKARECAEALVKHLQALERADEASRFKEFWRDIIWKVRFDRGSNAVKRYLPGAGVLLGEYAVSTAASQCSNHCAGAKIERRTQRARRMASHRAASAASVRRGATGSDSQALCQLCALRVQVSGCGWPRLICRTFPAADSGSNPRGPTRFEGR